MHAEEHFRAEQVEYERLTFTAAGAIVPCYPHNDESSTVVFIPPRPPFELPMPYEPLSNALSSIEPSCHAVTRGLAYHSSTSIYALTAFFVSPTICVTSLHNLYDTKGYKASQVWLSREDYSDIQVRDILKTPLHTTIVYEPPLEYSKDPETGRTVLVNDFVFLRVNDKNYRHAKYLLPSNSLPKAGDNVFTIQYNGELEPDFLGRHQDIPSTFHCSVAGVSRHLFPNFRSVGVGKVTAINDMIVSYGVSTCPGSSGAPVMSEQELDRFFAIHQGTVWDDAKATTPKYAPGAANHGTLVSNPVFLEAYKNLVPADFERCGVALPEYIKLLASQSKQTVNDSNTPK